MNYGDIREIAKLQNAEVGDLIALAPNNDPFYVGRPNDWKQGNWFKDLWLRFGYSTGIHLRRVHYQVMSQSPVVLLPNRWAFTVSEGVRDEAGDLVVPAGALIIASTYFWRGPRMKNDKLLSGESLRFLPAARQSLPGQVRAETTYYVAKVGEAKANGERYRWVQVTDQPHGHPMRLTPGTGGILAEPYENTEKCWDYLSQAGKVARYLGLVDMNTFVDRRNPDPRLYAEVERPDPFVQVNPQDWTPELPEMPELPGYEVGGYRGRQRYHLEIWCEKSTMNDVLIPTCQRYKTNLVTGLGEMSITSVLAVLERIKQGGRPTIIWYISDYDPAGQSMPVAVSRKIEYLVRGDEENDPVDIRLIPLVMTAAQIEQYNLPRTPIKEEERRAEVFEARHGKGAVELDAFEALYPGELSLILMRAIEDFYDHGLSRAVNDARTELMGQLGAMANPIYEQYEDEIAELREEYEDIQRQVAAILAPWTRKQVRLWAILASRLEDEDYTDLLEECPIPEAEESPALLELDPLYHSDRGYSDQLRYYKEHQRKDAIEVEDDR